MQPTDWTPSMLLTFAIAGIVVLALGYALATLRQGRRAAELEARLKQAEESLSAARNESQQQQEELRRLNAELHDKALSETQLQTRLAAAQHTEQRLNETLAEQKRELEELRQALDAARNAHHTTERQLEAAQADNRALQSRITELQGQIAELKDTLAAHESRYNALQERHQALSNEHTELKTTLERREEHFREQMEQLSETRTSLTKEFENLANKIFEEKGKTFTHTSQATLDNLLKPFREQIEGFQKRINDVHDASLKGNASLNAEIRKVMEIGLQMSKEASNLASALKGDSQQRGAWGEAQLRRTLEMSGLVEDTHYEAQTAFKDADGNRKQTDYLIKLPDGKHIIIDSKVSLNAYDKAVSAETEEAWQAAMAEHVRAVKRHIDDLASKDYTNLIGMRSPSFVLMFMPIEPAYIEALKYQKDLFEYGYKKGVVLVSHTTLIPILRTVANLWMLERSNAEAREISEMAGEIYNSVVKVAERLQKLGNTLGTVSNHYNSTVTALVGKQGLYGKVDRFSQLSAKVSKTLPAIDPQHLDFESERLSMVAEPIEEADSAEALPPAEDQTMPPDEASVGCDG